MYLLCTTTALIYYALSVHLLSVVRLYSRSSPASLLVLFGSLFSPFQTFLIIFALAFLFRSSRVSLSLSLSFVTTGSVTWAAWISASAFCPSCAPRRERRRNERTNQICRRSRRRYNAKQKEKKKKNDDDESYEHDENKNSENNNNNRVTSSSTRRRKRFSRARSRV